MTVNTTIGYGAEFQRETATPGTYASVSELIALTPPNVSLETVDATHFESPDAYREYIAGLLDGGEVEVTLNFDPDGSDWADYISDIEARAAVNYKIILADTTAITLAAIPTGYTPEIPLDDKMTITFTYKVTGKPTVA